MRWIGALAFTLSLVPWAVGSAQDVAPPEPPTIARIVVRTHNVFDSTEAAHNFLFRLANGLRFTTRPSVVRHELLFKEGEPYDSAKVADLAPGAGQDPVAGDLEVAPSSTADFHLHI